MKKLALSMILSSLLLSACSQPAMNIETPTSQVKAETIIPSVEGELKVYFLDVGQGDSTYIKTPNGNDILIDAGDRGLGDEVVSYLKEYGVDDLEAVIVTHPDTDHIGGLPEVFEEFVVESVYAPKVSHTTKTYEKLLNAIADEGVKIKTAKAGTTLGLSDVSAEFLAPVGDYGTDLNEWSAVLRLQHGDRSFLFTGDAEKKSEEDMISTESDKLDVDVLKVGHHGSSSSTSAEFLSEVSPEIAVISVGADNKYQHPTDQTLDTLANENVEVHRTDKEGTILISTDGTALTTEITK